MQPLPFLVASLLALTMLAGCNDTYEPGPDAVDVRVELQYDTSQGTYIEGFGSYIRVEEPDGELLFERQLSELSGKVPTFHSTDYVRLDPGEYQLISFQRPGSASGGLDPPTNRCEQRIRVTGNPKLTILISAQAFESCNIERVQTLEIAGSCPRAERAWVKSGSRPEDCGAAASNRGEKSDWARVRETEILRATPYPLPRPEKPSRRG